MKAVIEKGRVNLPRSDYIIDETITTIFSRTRSFELAKRFGETIINSNSIKKIKERRSHEWAGMKH
ncbi:MAG: hypothetical protein AB1595_07070 [bacterium]